jgi:hypothetical protein
MDNLTNTEPLLARRPGVELHYSQRPMPGNSGANGTQHTVALEYGTDSEQDELLMLVHSCLGDRGQRLPHGTTFLATLVGSQFRVVDSGARRLARSVLAGLLQSCQPASGRISSQATHRDPSPRTFQRWQQVSWPVDLCCCLAFPAAFRHQ